MTTVTMIIDKLTNTWLPAIGEDIKSGIFDDEPTRKQILMVALALALFWVVAFKMMMDSIYLLIRHEPEWIIRAADRDYVRQGKQLAERFDMDSSPEGCRKQFIQMWPWMQAVLIQHFFGGFLCAPSLFNLMPNNPSLANSLACLGILSEMGWELQDIVGWIYTRYCTKNGKERVPFPFLIMLAMHHSMTMSLGAPLILHYRNLRTLHWLCFDLQLGAAVSLGVAEYTKLLDLSIPHHMNQFQFLTTFALVGVVWTRVFHWVWLIGEFMMVWYAEKAYGFLVVGGLLGTGFTFVSYAIAIEPYYKRWHKFVLRRREYQQVVQSKTATERQRRSSFLALDEAAEQMLLEIEGEQRITVVEKIADLILNNVRSKEEIERRASLPASLKLGNCVRRRSSFLRSLQDQSGIAEHQDDDGHDDDDDSDGSPPPTRRATYTSGEMDDSMSESLTSLVNDHSSSGKQKNE